MKNTLVAILTLSSIMSVRAQDTLKNTLTIGGYIDSYYAAYNTSQSQDELLPLISTGARDNTIGVNMAQLSLNYEGDKVRSEIIFHRGDIQQATWSDTFPYLQAANAGVKLSNDLWLDAGFFATHLGTESFLPKNNNLSSIAVLTYMEPFYQSGAKLSWQSSDNLYLEGWVLNGYNSFVDNNDSKSVGLLASYDINESTSITYTNLYGRESEDDLPLKQRRFYNNIYLDKNWNEQFFLTIGFDYATQTNTKIVGLIDPPETAKMFAGLITARYQFTPEWSVTGRMEFINDEDGFITDTYETANNTLVGLNLTGFTLGTEYRPMDGAYLRFEGRRLQASEDLEIFFDGDNRNDRLELLITLGLSVDKVFKF